MNTLLKPMSPEMYSLHEGISSTESRFYRDHPDSWDKFHFIYLPRKKEKKKLSDKAHSFLLHSESGNVLLILVVHTLRQKDREESEWKSLQQTALLWLVYTELASCLQNVSERHMLVFKEKKSCSRGVFTDIHRPAQLLRLEFSLVTKLFQAWWWWWWCEKPSRISEPLFNSFPLFKSQLGPMSLFSPF